MGCGANDDDDDDRGGSEENNKIKFIKKSVY